MKTRLLAIACGVAAISIGAGAQADVIAGWDFSQYEKPGSLDGGGSTPAATNSVEDPNGAGAESGAIGTATIGGAGTLLPSAGASQNGTQATPGIRGYSPRGPITSNESDPFVTGQTAFNALATLADEGQTSTNLFAMAADGSVTVDFAATPASSYEDWAVSFGAKMLNGGGTDGGEQSCAGACGTSVAVSLDTGSGFVSFDEVSVDGGTPAPGSVDLTPEDRRYRVTFPNSGDSTSSPVVRIAMAGGPGTGTPLIDNVAIEAVPLPEPGALLGLLAGAGMLAGLRRLRA